MSELKRFQELRPGCAVVAGEADRLKTGGWRAGRKPQVEMSSCVNCLLCWVYCPDGAIRLDGTDFLGFDYDLCKGCELCVEVCPVGAITMVAEGTPLPRYGRIEG
jgi:2-oxoacid:acceptor oxidoreductase delta subunit (pyruvate/2-ketoisovalerate family)